MDNNILFQNTLYKVDDFYDLPRDLLWCKKCNNPIEKGGLQYVNIQTTPFFRINECFFHTNCYSSNVIEEYCSRPKSPHIRVYRGDQEEKSYYFTGST
jgi:hypothetical protein